MTREPGANTVRRGAHVAPLNPEVRRCLRPEMKEIARNALGGIGALTGISGNHFIYAWLNPKSSVEANSTIGQNGSYSSCALPSYFSSSLVRIHRLNVKRNQTLIHVPLLTSSPLAVSGQDREAAV